MRGGDAGSEQGAGGVAEVAGAADNCRAGEPIAALAAAAAAGCIFIFILAGFVADVGGYFGLLLGGSIPSILESIFDLYSKFINVKTNKIDTMNV